MDNESTTAFTYKKSASNFSLNIIIIDDEKNIRKTLSYCLSSMGHVVTEVSNFDDAVEINKQHIFHLAFLDLRLGEKSGLNLLPVLLKDSPWLKIVIITAYATLETAVKTVHSGAFDYISKPFSVDQIRLVAEQVSRFCQLERENETLKNEIGNTPELFWETKNPGFHKILDTLKKAASSDAIILLLGENGTGKSVLARAIHNWSLRKENPFGVISCPSVPSELFESELYGHIKGSFTGAVKDNPGRIISCEGGTLFLDEIGEIPLSRQVKFLRFIQDKEYEKLGESICRKADVRIICATNSNLQELVSKGEFREDLYYRINVITLTIPPLRERKEDIVPLALKFLLYFNRVNNKKVNCISQKAKEILQSYSWPGNIRELRNYIERAVILSNKEILDIEDLPENLISFQPTIVLSSEQLTLAKVEELHIIKILKNTNSIQEAAQVLGIDQTTLWRKRKALNILID